MQEEGRGNDGRGKFMNSLSLRLGLRPILPRFFRTRAEDHGEKNVGGEKRRDALHHRNRRRRRRRLINVYPTVEREKER